MIASLVRSFSEIEKSKKKKFMRLSKESENPLVNSRELPPPLSPVVTGRDGTGQDQTRRDGTRLGHSFVRSFVGLSCRASCPSLRTPVSTRSSHRSHRSLSFVRSLRLSFPSPFPFPLGGSISGSECHLRARTCVRQCMGIFLIFE